MDQDGMSELQRGRLLNLTAAGVVDALMELGEDPRVLDRGIRPVLPFSKLAGRAFTIEFDTNPRPPEEGPLKSSGVMQALDQFVDEERGPGWVLVLANPDPERAVPGEGFSMWTRTFGLVGIVTDGPARDSHEVAGRRVPLFSRGLSPIGPYNALSVKAVDVPVMVAGVEVCPGDVMVADHDGVTVFDPGLVETVIERAAKHAASIGGLQASMGTGRRFSECLSDDAH